MSSAVRIGRVTATRKARIHLTNAATPTQPLTEAAPVRFTAGRATITLLKVHDGFHVQVMQGTRRVDAWSCSYPDETEARAEARRAARAFRQFRTADALAAEHHRLTVAIDSAEKCRRPTGRLNDLRDAIQPLQGRAADQDLAARILGTIRAAAAVQAQPPAQRARTWKTLRDEFAQTHPSI